MPHECSSYVVSDVEAPQNSFGMPSHFGLQNQGVILPNTAGLPLARARLDGKGKTFQYQTLSKLIRRPADTPQSYDSDS